MANITLRIDGRAVSVPSGTTVMDAARELGIEIPALCHDKSLPVASACRLCIVEVGGSSKLQTSCSLLARDGMDIRTGTDRIGSSGTAGPSCSSCWTATPTTA